MPVLTNSIGGYQFLELEGAIYSRQQQKELIERPGVDGSGARKTGQRGKPFRLVSTNYEPTFQDAANKLADYISLCDLDAAVSLIRHGVDEGGFLVLEVQEQARYAIFSALGGFTGGEQCCHVVAWTLLG